LKICLGPQPATDQLETGSRLANNEPFILALTRHSSVEGLYNSALATILPLEFMPPAARAVGNSAAVWPYGVDSACPGVRSATRCPREDW